MNRNRKCVLILLLELNIVTFCMQPNAEQSNNIAKCPGCGLPKYIKPYTPRIGNLPLEQALKQPGLKAKNATDQSAVNTLFAQIKSKHARMMYLQKFKPKIHALIRDQYQFLFDEEKRLIAEISGAAQQINLLS